MSPLAKIKLVEAKSGNPNPWLEIYKSKNVTFVVGCDSAQQLAIHLFLEAFFCSNAPGGTPVHASLALVVGTTPAGHGACAVI